ncbi:phage portal protein [Agromyces laixinhei]|uniref:phage portal protein n=1 Tax=Agromyces laixinhei TaxID=2585717 RepID=UPI0012EE8313|nr:phage portal protein [Agromyces laixinhei]
MVSVGILDVLGLGRRPDYLAQPAQLASPWAPEGNMQSIVWSDILGAELLENMPLTRAEAIGIPAVSKARNLIVSTVSKWPLYALAGPARVDPQPTFLYRTDGAQSPYTRMVWTLDDGIMYGCSLWLLERGNPVDGRRPITDAERVPFDWWEFKQIKGVWRIVLRPGGTGPERVVEDHEAALFDFPFEGLLNIGLRTLRGARDQERAWVGRAKNPVPVINLKRTEDTEMTDQEVAEEVQKWATARTNPNGAIGSTPVGVQLETFGEVAVDLMIEGRNAVRTDVGSFLNVRAAMLDGTIGVDSLTYTTSEGERNAFYELDLPFWTDPIEARLSLDDIVPRGQRTRFEKYESSPALTGPEVKD